MIKKITSIIAILALVGGGWLFLASRQNPEPENITDQLVALLENGDEAGFERLLAESAERNLNGYISVRGVVQDENGAELNGVSLAYQVTHLATVAANAYADSRTTEIDGEFELQCDDCSGIEADFSKEGYYTVDREWIGFAPGRSDVRVEEHDVVVTLGRRGEPAPLEEFRGQLQTGANETVLPFSFARGTGVMRTDDVAQRAANENIAQPIYLRLSVETDDAGNASLEQVTRPDSNVVFDRPRLPQLQIVGDEGGFIAYEPEAQEIRLADREMSLAPVDAYRNNLDIVRLDGLPQYFYCFIGGRYCRGTVFPVGSVRSDDNSITARVSVSIQMNVNQGDRNLTPRD